MEPRIDTAKYSSNGALHAHLQLEAYLQQCGLEHGLLHLIKVRASQINGCAYCLDMHTIDARAGGETEQRLYVLNAWRETPFFTSRERAALEWTEALTLIAGRGVPDELFDATREHFTEEELVNLTYAVASINAWNRLMIAVRGVPGNYQAREKTSAAGASTATSRSGSRH